MIPSRRLALRGKDMSRKDGAAAARHPPTTRFVWLRETMTGRPSWSVLQRRMSSQEGCLNEYRHQKAVDNDGNVGYKKNKHPPPRRFLELGPEFKLGHGPASPGPTRDPPGMASIAFCFGRCVGGWPCPQELAAQLSQLGQLASSPKRLEFC